MTGHLDGFLMMTVVTALAASAFGLFLQLFASLEVS